MEEIQQALIRLNDAICTFERSSSREFTLALIPHDPLSPVDISVNGKPIEKSLNRVALMNALLARSIALGLPVSKECPLCETTRAFDQTIGTSEKHS